MTPPQPWGDVVPDKDPILRASRDEPARLCALLMLREALLRQPGFLERSMLPGAISVFDVPDKPWGRRIAWAWNLVVEALQAAPVAETVGEAVVAAGRRGSRQHPSDQTRSQAPERPHQFLFLDDASKIAANVELCRESVGEGRPTHLFSPSPDTMIAADILVAAEQVLRIPSPDAAILSLLAGSLCSGTPWPPIRLPQVPEGLTAMAREVSPFLVDACHRPGQGAEAFIGRLAILVSRQQALAPRIRVHPPVTLDDLPGLGAVGEWGRQVAADMQAYARGELGWSDMDRGIVIEGPPGTGKSTFARALASSAGVPLIATSLSQWQGAREGHLGHLLGAMHATFAEARRRAPCVMLLDEVDSFPARSSVTHGYRDYVVQVVDALLEQLDGAVERAGVIVVGTCNDASNLDPAMVRPGRLERVVRLEHPDASDLGRILRVHLGADLPGEDLRSLAMAAAARGATGADVARWCRGGRRNARTAGRAMILADLAAEIGPVPAVHTADAVRRMAVHEAGHAVGFAMLGSGVVQRVVVDPAVGGRSTTTVDLSGIIRDAPHGTRLQLLAELRAILAGRAAEETILGVVSSGAGGSAASDLARATRLASVILASSGLDEHPEHLLFLASADDPRRMEQLLLLPEIRQRTAAILVQAYNESLDLVRHRLPALERISEALVTSGSLSGYQVEALLARDALDDATDDTMSGAGRS